MIAPMARLFLHFGLDTECRILVPCRNDALTRCKVANGNRQERSPLLNVFEPNLLFSRGRGLGSVSWVTTKIDGLAAHYKQAYQPFRHCKHFNGCVLISKAYSLILTHKWHLSTNEICIQINIIEIIAQSLHCLNQMVSIL